MDRKQTLRAVYAMLTATAANSTKESFRGKLYALGEKIRQLKSDPLITGQTTVHEVSECVRCPFRHLRGQTGFRCWLDPTIQEDDMAANAHSFPSDCPLETQHQAVMLSRN